ncbi:hypothetical protein WJX72_000820 [[Myrmecia] bisecta]|uniref:TerD domain-containing protein n=1 Tax=[Myrmecia] bisecta TaxID=41462 RepID=A0AAW1QNS7_9CHLO
MGTSVTQMGQLVSIPFRALRLSFEASWASANGVPLDIDLSCCLFGADGCVRGYAGAGQLAADDGAVQHQRAADGNSETVSVSTTKLDPRTEALVFVAAVLDSPVRTANLASPDQLVFRTLTSDLGGASQELATCDLKPFVAEDKQSMVVGALYRTADGWVTYYCLAAQNIVGWDIMPAMLRACLGAMPGFNNQFKDAFEDEKLVRLLRRNEDRQLDWLTSLRTGCPTAVTQLRVDVGWEANDGEEIEGQELEFNCMMYNAQDEEVQAVNSKSKDGEGVSAVPDDPAEEEPAEEAEAEEGEEGEGKPATEATPPKPKDPFPLKDSFIITFAGLPQAVSSILVTINNFGGSGLTHLRSAKVRLVDASAGSSQELGTFTVASAENADADKTSVVMCKLYKESKSSAYSVVRWWSSTSAILTDPYTMKSCMGALLAQQQAILKAAKRVAELTEAGEEVPADLQASSVAPFDWRLNVNGQMLSGPSLEETGEELKRIANYTGRSDSANKRSDSHARALYANGDTYFGQYASDRRNGEGFYAIASGGAYAGTYVDSNRSGQGVLLLPDSAIYVGSFAADKFEGPGQYTYPDSSTYVGDWKAGKKHGQGVYWDPQGGCLRGTWEAGVLQGQGTYDVPAYQFSGEFKSGVPAGDCSFTMCASRLLDLPATACAHILADSGPTLVQRGKYAIPAGAADAPAEGEEESEERPALPAFPKYEGLSYSSASALPAAVPDTPFPPPGAPSGIEYIQMQQIQAAA